MNKSNTKIGKIVILAVLSIAMVLAFIAMFNAMGIMMDKDLDAVNALSSGTASAVKASFWMYMGMSLGLAGCVAAIVLKMLGKDEITPFIFIGAGVVAMICFFISIGMNSDNLDNLKKAMDAAKKSPMKIMGKLASMGYYKEILISVINILIFGGVPVAYGVKGLLNK